MLFISFCTSPQSSELYGSADEVIPSSKNEATSTTSTTTTCLHQLQLLLHLHQLQLLLHLHQLQLLLHLHQLQLLLHLNYYCHHNYTTTIPQTTTTLVPETSSYSLKFGDEINQFPKSYCKMQYEEVREINNHFNNQDIRLTIREMLVETDNTDCMA